MEVIHIDRFLDADGRITSLPSKQKVRSAVMQYLAQKFASDRTYTEKEVNEVCNQWHTFQDYFILRRGLIEEGCLMRKPDGSCYWKPKHESQTDA